MTSPSESQRPPFRGQRSLPESLSTRFGHLFPGVWDHLTLSWYLSLSIHGPPICRLNYLLKLIVRLKATLQCFRKCLCRAGGYLSPNIWSLRVDQQGDILPFFSSNVQKKKKKTPKTEKHPVKKKGSSGQRNLPRPQGHIQFPLHSNSQLLLPLNQLKVPSVGAINPY